MYYYKLYGTRIASDFKLEQLITLSQEEQHLPPQIIIQERNIPKEYKRQQECYSVIDRNKSIISNSYCYLLIEKGEKIFYEKKEKITSQLLNAYLLGWGISTLFYQRGELAIHCSCVAKEGKAVLLSGNSGSGKSTMTSELLQQGYSFMADDISVIKYSEDEEVFATAAFPYQKLCRDVTQTLTVSREEMIYIDEMKDKFLVPYQGVFEEKATKVKAMIILTITKEDKVVVTELSGAEKLHACMNALFLKPLLGEALYEPQNGVQVLKFASKIPVYQIQRPIERDSKKEVLEALVVV